MRRPAPAHPARRLGLALAAALGGLAMTFGLGALTGCTPQSRAAQPPLFILRDADTKIWLLGTIHALPQATNWRSAAAEKGMAEADTLVTEIPPVAPQNVAAIFLKRSKAPVAHAIAARVPMRRRAALAAAIARAGLSAETLDRLKTWAAAILLANAQLRAGGVSPDAAPEAALARTFAARQRVALETPDGQFALFDGLGEADQRVLLDNAIDAPAQYQRTLSAWAAGDVVALAATLAPLALRAPAAHEALVTARNRRWAAWIARRMTKPGTLLIAVGAGHLAGPQSVVAMLRSQGFKVAQVR